MRPTRCPWCDELMDYNEDRDFFTCPNGCGEWWPQDEDAQVLFRKDVNEKRRNVRGSGSSSGRRHKKDVKRKPTDLWEG
jgi:hypothetical protein